VLSPPEGYSWTRYKSHARKALPSYESYITPASDDAGRSFYKIVDFHETLAPMWKSLKQAVVDLEAFEATKSKIATAKFLGGN
jgi:hypothetical protein